MEIKRLRETSKSCSENDSLKGTHWNESKAERHSEVNSVFSRNQDSKTKIGFRSPTSIFASRERSQNSREGREKAESARIMKYVRIMGSSGYFPPQMY